MKPNSTLRSYIALAGSSLLAISSAQAQTFIWDGGGGDDNFGTALNWNTNTTPSTGSGVTLYFTGGTRTAPVNNYATGDIFGEWRLTGASPFTITGNGFKVFKIENSSTTNQLFTINTAGIYSSGGVMQINPVGGNITIGSSTAVELDGNATLFVFDGGGGIGRTLTINGTLSNGNGTGGNGELNLQQTATVILTGANDYGTTTLNANTTLRIGDGGTTGTLGTGNVNNSSGTLIFNRSNDFSVSNLITGTAGRVTKQGAGVLTLSNTNTYTGATTLSAGTLSVGSIGNGGVAGNLGQASNVAANLVFDGGTLRYTGGTATSDRAFTINAGKTATLDVTNSLSLAGATGAATTGALTKTGNGTLTLTGASTYSGGTTISTGTLQASNSSALGTGSVSVAAGAKLGITANSVTLANNITLNGLTTNGAIFSGNLGVNNVTNLTGQITLNSTSNVSTWWHDKTLRLSGKITGSGGLDFITQPGSVGGRYFVTGATNDYSGATSVTGATGGAFVGVGWSDQSMLYLGATNALPTTSALTLNNADLYLNGQSQTLPSISGTGSFSVQNGSTTAATLTLGAGNTTSTFSGTIKDNGLSVTNTAASISAPLTTGTVALTKTGTGTLTLSGTNNYTGATNVNGGTLRINGNQTSATGAVTVASTATLGGSGTIGGAVTVNAGGFHAAGNSIGTQTMLAGYTQNGTEQVELGTPGGTPAAGVSDRTVVTGALNLGGASTLQLIDNAGANAQGSMGAGAYRLITFSGTRTGTFNTVTNPLSATLHEKVIYNGTSNGSVDLEVYRLATANAIGTPVNLTNVRVGGTFGTSALSIQNTASNDGFSEGLNATQGAVTGHASVSGTNITNLAGGATSSTISVGLGGAANTGTAGAKTGTVAIGLASNGTNSGYANTALTGQTVTVNGAVYNAAAANTIASVDVGKTRVGGILSGTATLNISNTAAAGIYTEGLNATVGSTTGGASGSGSISNLAGAASSTAISLSIAGASTSTSGIKSGTVNINLASNGTNSGLADLGLGSQTVGVSGTVYDYADAAFSKTSGDGNLSGGGNSYTMDFGTGLELNTTYTATIQLANTLLSSFQDELGGSYGSIVSSEYNSGVEATTIASLVAGSNSSFTITFFTGTTGIFSDSLTFSGLSKQSGLSDASLGNFTIALTATAVPEPRAALLGGLGLLMLLRRRRP
jgi:fibronectin-binding autotransporter adhesin